MKSLRLWDFRKIR